MATSAEIFLKRCRLDKEFLASTEKYYGVPPHILLGMIKVESSGNPEAMRYEPKYPYLHKLTHWAKKYRWTIETEKSLQRFSYGLLQIMGSTARQIGFDFHPMKLLEPRIGASWGAAYLSDLYRRYNDWDDAISAYNQGTPRKNWMTGAYRNQRYVDLVRHYAERYNDRGIQIDG